MRIFWILAALSLPGSACALEVGQRGPDLEYAGESVAGKVVLVNFWATWCAPCKKELPLLDALHERIAADGAMVLTVNIDARPKLAEATVKHLAFGAPVLYDPVGQIAKQFEPPAMPTTYLLDTTGAVRKVIVGDVDRAAITELEAEIRTLARATQ